MRKFYDTVYLLFMTFCKCLFIASIIITSYVVVMRFFFSKTPRWGEQAILLTMVYMALISASLAIRTDRHLRVYIIEHAFPLSIRPKAMSVLHAVSQIIIFLFSLFMIIYGTKFCVLMSKSTMSGIPIKMSFLYASVPIAGLCMLLMESERFILFILKMLKIPVEGYYDYNINPPLEEIEEVNTTT